jgi:hypothetical protein
MQYHHVIPAKAGIHPLVKAGRHTARCVSSHTAPGIHPLVKGDRHTAPCVSSHTAPGIHPLVKGDRHTAPCVSSHTALGIHPLVKGGRHTEGVRGDFLLSLVFRLRQVTFFASPKKVTKERRPCGAGPGARAPELPRDARSLRFARCGERPVIVCSA